MQIFRERPENGIETIREETLHITSNVQSKRLQEAAREALRWCGSHLDACKSAENAPCIELKVVQLAIQVGYEPAFSVINLRALYVPGTTPPPTDNTVLLTKRSTIEASSRAERGYTKIALP